MSSRNDGSERTTEASSSAWSKSNLSGWDFLIAGGAGYNNLDYSFSAKHPSGDLTDFKSPGGGGKDLRRSLAVLRRFLRRTPPDSIELKRRVANRAIELHRYPFA